MAQAQAPPRERDRIFRELESILVSTRVMKTRDEKLKSKSQVGVFFIYPTSYFGNVFMGA